MKSFLQSKVKSLNQITSQHFHNTIANKFKLNANSITNKLNDTDINMCKENENKYVLYNRNRFHMSNTLNKSKVNNFNSNNTKKSITFNGNKSFVSITKNSRIYTKIAKNNFYFSKFLSKNFFGGGKQSNQKDYYKILGINKGASKSEIKASFFKLAKEWHPDRNKAKGAKEQFAEISE